MFTMFSQLIRPEILLLCVALNVWGIVVYIFHTRKKLVTPFTYTAFREDCIDAEGEQLALKLDKLAGYSADKEPIRQDA